MKVFLGFIALLISIALNQELDAELVTFTFSGNVISVDNVLQSEFSVGQSVFGFYTFDTEPTGCDGLSNESWFEGAIVDSSISIDNTIFSGITGNILLDDENQLSDPWHNYIDLYEVGFFLEGENPGGYYPVSALISLRDDQGDALANEYLHVIPPDLNLFEYTEGELAFIDDQQYVQLLRYDISGLERFSVPNSGTVWLLATGLIGLEGLRKRFKKIQL